MLFGKFDDTAIVLYSTKIYFDVYGITTLAGFVKLYHERSIVDLTRILKLFILSLLMKHLISANMWILLHGIGLMLSKVVVFEKQP